MATCLFALAIVTFSTQVLSANVLDDAKLRYFYSYQDNYTELPLDEATRIFLFPWYNANRSTVIFAHGFTGRPDGPAVSAVIGTYLDLNENNVVLLNWQDMAASIQPSMANSYVNWAAPNARKLGVRFADTLLNLAEAGLDLDRTHLIGHSLGAHIFGIAGFRLLDKGIKMPWITGLDPAGVGFTGKPIANRLSPISADYVAVIHSDPSKYGFARQLGTVDFWPNYRNGGPIIQPGCDSRNHPMFSPEDLCNHNRSWELLIDALKNPGTILGSYAKNFRTWKNYLSNERNITVMGIGTYPEKIVPGNYYLVTNSAIPYGLGEDGL